MRPLASVTASRKSRTRQSTAIVSARGRAPAASTRSARRPGECEDGAGSCPQTRARTRFSVSVCRTSRSLPAPIAVRSENSWRRAAARASTRLATLAQAMSSTRPTEPKSSHSARDVVGPITRSVRESVRTPKRRSSRDGPCAGARRSYPSRPVPRPEWPPRREPREHDVAVPAAGALVELSAADEERPPQLDLDVRELEVRRHHADDLDGRAIELDLPAEHVRIRGEALPPERMADHDDPRCLDEVGRFECPPQERRRAQQLEKARRDEGQRDPLGVVGAGDRAARELRPHVSGHLAELPAFRLPVAEVEIRRAVGQVLADVPGPEHGDPLGLVVRQVAQHHRLEHAEDGGVGADTERQRQHRDRGEGRILDQRADAEPEILQEAVHGWRIRRRQATVRLKSVTRIQRGLISNRLIRGRKREKRDDSSVPAA